MATSYTPSFVGPYDQSDVMSEASFNHHGYYNRPAGNSKRKDRGARKGPKDGWFKMRFVARSSDHQVSDGTPERPSSPAAPPRPSFMTAATNSPASSSTPATPPSPPAKTTVVSPLVAWALTSQKQA